MTNPQDQPDQPASPATDPQDQQGQTPTSDPQPTPQPDQPVSQSSGIQPSETADGIRWGAALPIDDGKVRLTAFYSDGVVATTDATDQEAARAALRAYHTPKGA